MKSLDWTTEFPSAVTLTDAEGTIVYMNDKSVDVFKNEGGAELIGTNLEDCHNPASNRIIKRIKSSGNPNTYIVKKKGVRKLIHQSPWFKDGLFAGLVELSIQLPMDMMTITRD